MTRNPLQAILFTVTTILFIHPAAAERPAIAGTWQLDVNESRFGNMPHPVYGLLTIANGSHKVLHIAMTTKGPDSEHTVESDWKVDDRYHPVDGSGSGELLAKWDGAILVGKKLAGDTTEEIRFRLGPGNETLTESIQSGTNVTTLIWHRR